MLTWNFFFYSKERSFACLSKKNSNVLGSGFLSGAPLKIGHFFLIIYFVKPKKKQNKIF